MSIKTMHDTENVNLVGNVDGIKTMINDMIEFTKYMVIDSEDKFKKITTLYSQAKTWKDVIENKRKVVGEPLRKQISMINDKAKELTDPLDKVISLTKVKTGEYQIFLEDRKKREEEELKKAAELFGVSEDLYVPPMESTIRGDGAFASTVVERKFRVQELSKVPMKYLMINEDVVKRDLKLGIDAIEGLEIYEEKTVRLTRR